MGHVPHLRASRSVGYDPWHTRVDERIHCSVCGFAGINPDQQQEPERAQFTIVTTGTTYAVPAGTPVEDMALADLRTETQIPVGAG